MITLIDLAPWVARLIAECPVFAGRVIETIPDPDLLIDELESPVAFVYVDSDESSANRLVGSVNVRQEMTVNVVIETHVRRSATLTDKYNQVGSATVKTARTQLLSSLVGWRPVGYLDAVYHTSGSVKKQPKVLKQSDAFAANIVIQNRKT
jgi:hypothetical protein